MTTDIMHDLKYAIARQRRIDSWLAMRLDIDVWSELDRESQRYLAANTDNDEYLPIETRRAMNLLRFIDGAESLAWYRVPAS